jgi:hypothetical protein
VGPISISRQRGHQQGGAAHFSSRYGAGRWGSREPVDRLPGLQDVDWDPQDGHYRVRIQGEWFVVPDDSVVTEPNRFGPAVVWPYIDRYGNTRIRCFIPGAGT